jgi:hypothetical protein
MHDDKTTTEKLFREAMIALATLTVITFGAIAVMLVLR